MLLPLNCYSTKGEEMFDFDATFIWQFLLLTALLNAIFYKPLTKVLDERDNYPHVEA